MIAALGGVRGKSEGLQLRQAGPAEQLGTAGEAVVQGDGMQAILDHGADADEAHAVHEERAQIASGGIRHPDRGEAIVAQQIEDLKGVTPIGFVLRTTMARIFAASPTSSVCPRRCMSV